MSEAMNLRPDHYTFQHYLAAKRTVDDRALNWHVWQSLHRQLAERKGADTPLTILEIGGGIGTMIERLIEDRRLPPTIYHLIDEQPENIATAHQRLAERFGARHIRASSTDNNSMKSEKAFLVAPTQSFLLDIPGGAHLEVHLYTADLFDFLSRAGSLEHVDLVIAHAFMDLVDIPATLPKMTTTLPAGALLYFTINFDGATILEPTIDKSFDTHIEQIYHRTMDERITDGKRSGDSQTGRHLYHQLKTAGIQTVDAGSSDWVIIPHDAAYPHDEAYFLHFIINTMHSALRHHPEIDTKRFDAWIAERHTQIEAGELIYIAHQLDYLGRYQP